MKVLVISDSHSSAGLISKAYDAEKPDAIFFLGDGLEGFLEFRDYELPASVNTFLVTGNCDFMYEGKFAESQVASVCGVRFFLSHGNKYGVSFTLRNLCDAAEAENCAFALYGHTHRQKMQKIGKVTAVNPGTLQNGDYAVIEIAGGKADINLTCLPVME